MQIQDIAGQVAARQAVFLLLAATCSIPLGTILYGRELYKLNSAPTNIAISNNMINENVPLGTEVGTLSATDPDAGSTITFSLPIGMGDNSALTIVGNSLRTASPINFETRSTLNITVRATDNAGAFADQVLAINVNNLAELGSPVQIGGGTTNRSIIKQLVVDFDSDVVVDAGAFLLQKRTSATVLDTVNTSFALSTLPSGATRATITFSGAQTYSDNSLSDGYYQLSIFGASVRLRSNNQAFDGNGDA